MELNKSDKIFLPLQRIIDQLATGWEIKLLIHQHNNPAFVVVENKPTDIVIYPSTKKENRMSSEN